jgi:dienelactone hydrolase
MPANVPRLKAPLLWIIGERDRMYERGEAYAFSKVPANAKNAYVVVKGGHGATPKKGKSEILEWMTN